MFENSCIFFFLEYTDIIQNIRKGVRTMYINLINLKRWCLLIYSIFSAVVTVIYIMFNSTFYKLDLVRYSNDINYYNKMSAILPKGLLQLLSTQFTFVNYRLPIRSFDLFDFFNIKLGALLQKNIYTINIYDRISSSSANSQWRKYYLDVITGVNSCIYW